MRAIKNDTLTLTHPAKGAELRTVAELLRDVAQFSEAGNGMTAAEMAKRLRLVIAADAAHPGGDIALEDADHEQASRLADAMRWGWCDSAFIDFVNRVKNAPRPATRGE
jgi:hypothetical protein